MSTTVSASVALPLLELSTSDDSKKKEAIEAEHVAELRRVLRSAEPDGGKERCWNWRDAALKIGETMKARGSLYNGYPNTPGYFGSFWNVLDLLRIASFQYTFVTYILILTDDQDILLGGTTPLVRAKRWLVEEGTSATNKGGGKR